MQTNDRTAIIIVAALLIAAFFMPWLKFFISISAWDMLFGSVSEYVDTGFKYIALLIPVSGGLIIYGAGFNQGNYGLPKQLLFLLPLLSLLVMIIAFAVKVNESSMIGERVDLGNLVQLFGFGFWVTLLGSIVLPNLRSSGRPSARTSPIAPLPAASKVGILIMLAGFGLFIYALAGDFKKTRTYDDYDLNKGLGLPDAFNNHMLSEETYIDKQKKTDFEIAGIGVFVIGLIVYAAGRKGGQKPGGDPTALAAPPAYAAAAAPSSPEYNSSSSIPPEYAAAPVLPQDTPPPISPEYSVPVPPQEHASAPPVSTEYISPAVVPPSMPSSASRPEMEWKKRSLKAKDFLYRYRVGLAVAVLLVIAWIAVYYLFIKANPVKDGDRLAKNYCACGDELRKSNRDSMQSFYDGFDGKHFKSRQEARSALSVVLLENSAHYDQCAKAANVKYKEKLSDYRSAGGNDLYRFDQTYNSIITDCNAGRTDEAAAWQEKIDVKISAIVDPEPYLDKIKSDLIGHTVPGWQFAYLSEYRAAQILNMTKGGDRIEYKLKFDLVSNSDGSEHDCEVMAVYLLSDEGWSLSGVSLDYITYLYTFYPDRFVTYTPLQGCSWSAENTAKMLWRTSEGWFSDEVTTGPAEGPKTIPTSGVYYIKSLEPSEIKVKFTFKPAN